MKFWARIDIAHRARRLKSRTDIELYLLPALVERSKLSLDIGANKGVYTYHLQKLGRVIAFEPIPMLAGKLLRAAFRNVEVHNCGIGSETTVAELHIPRHRKKRGLNTPGANFRALDGALPADFEIHNIGVRRLDDFHFDNVGFIKLDVEGWEEQALRGGEETVARNRCNLLIEAVERIAPGIFDFLDEFRERHGYEMFYVAHGERMLRTLGDFDRANPNACNFMAFPKEKAAALVASCNALIA